MKKMVLIMMIIFMILAFLGAGYVLVNHSQINAGYAVVPMTITLSWSSILRVCVGEEKDKENR